MKHPVIQYTCPSCLVSYQESEGVEIVNRFGWKSPDRFKDKRCKACQTNQNMSKLVT